MLVGGGVIDGLHVVRLHQRAHQVFVEHRAYAGEYRHTMRRLFQLVVDGVERKLGMVEQHQLRGPLRDDLPAQLAADRAAGAGDQHHLARDVACEQAGVGRHGVATEQVDDIDFANV